MIERFVPVLTTADGCRCRRIEALLEGARIPVMVEHTREACVILVPAHRLHSAMLVLQAVAQAAPPLAA